MACDAWPGIENSATSPRREHSVHSARISTPDVMSSPDLRDQLQTTLGTAYNLGDELGGGGMSRVFVADETRLGRKVVVKLLSPELAAGVSAERFEREIMTAASLQQANIVPVL